MMPSKPTSSIQAVVFDYGNVLSCAPTAEDWQRLAATAARPLEEFRRDYWLYRDEYDRAACGPATYWQAVARRALDAPTLDRLIELDSQQWTRINPEMLALSRRLRAAGVKTAILSNMEFEMLAELRAKFAWINEFAVQVYSCEARMIKPQAAIFLHTAAKLEVKPGKILFIDDKQRNIEGARQAGMKAFLFDGPAKQAALEELLRQQGITLPAAEESAAPIPVNS
ncbi:MAG: HAD family phosphatase [Candidatus Korobacteraceae bacterium]